MIGQTLGHYRILEEVGAGGMGVVYRARDEQLERDVALKVLPPGTLGDDSARRNFRKEALALAKLNHPNIETVFEFGSQEGTDFLVLEYLPGRTLAQMLAAGKGSDCHRNANCRSPGGSARTRHHSSRFEACKHRVNNSRASQSPGFWFSEVAAR